MGKVHQFVLDFDGEKDSSCVYVAGQTINGWIRVELSKPVEIRRFYLQLKGKAKVQWTETHGKTVVCYRNKEELFLYEHDVLGSDKEKHTLDAGFHQFPFSCILPPDSASSFDADHGKVRYEAEAVIDRPWAFKERTHRIITVAGKLDCNDPNYCEFVNPITVDMSKDVSGLFSSGKVHTRITLSSKFLVPGNTVFLSAEIHNESNRKLEKVWLSLKQYIIYNAKTKTRRQSKRLNKITREELIPPGAVDSWVNVPIVVPQVPPTNLAGRCTILIVNYALKFYTDTGLKLSFPVVIGTVPVDSAFHADGFPLPTVPNQSIAAPPSYEEANRQNFSTEEGFGTYKM